jgi:hypothetical protein
MLYESFHRLVFPTVLIAVIGTVWVAAWSQELQAEVAKGSWPALPHRENRSSTTTDPSSQSKSLQQVLLKNDQVVSVR